MSISNSLRLAAKVQEKIEVLRKQLAELLDKARSELDSLSTEPHFATVHRSGRPKSGKSAAAAKNGGKTHRRSSLAGRKRAASPSGPLAPAVVKVLEQKKKRLSVREILEQLLKTGYVFNSPEPKKNLAARIYRLKGVKQVGAGLFAKG